MAETDQEQKSYEAQMELAVSAIAKSPEFRFFLRDFLTQVAALPQQCVFSPEVVQNAFDQGRQAAGLALIATITRHQPELWLQMQREEMPDASH